MSTPKNLRDNWPERGLMLNPESPIGLTPLPSRPENPNQGDTWFSDDGTQVLLRNYGRDLIWVDGETI